MVESKPVDELERLRRQASALTAKAEALSQAYNRSTWVRFVLVFFPVPLVVLLVRLYLEAWGYYLAGGAFIVCAAVLFSVDSAASARCDAAAKAAENAQKAYHDARLARSSLSTEPIPALSLPPSAMSDASKPGDDRAAPDGKAKSAPVSSAAERSTGGVETQPSASPTTAPSSSRELSEAELDKIVGGVSADP